MNRHEQREKAMVTVYQYLLVPRDLNELIENEYEMKPEEIDPYFHDVIFKAVENTERYGGYITNVLKEGWNFARLGYIEKAILLNGCAEFDLRQIEAAVIIDESVEMAKKYCDEDTYKLINSVLDII
ncbi:MAG: transcription antitermination factor NusB [Erysipelotrichaceae bacterium]|jgi:N utilization substance protein B|nr:transcription antitermination factor NusB [Erysipelotrichaceae bacterium]